MAGKAGEDGTSTPFAVTHDYTLPHRNPPPPRLPVETFCGKLLHSTPVTNPQHLNPRYKTGGLDAPFPTSPGQTLPLHLSSKSLHGHKKGLLL